MTCSCYGTTAHQTQDIGSLSPEWDVKTKTAYHDNNFLSSEEKELVEIRWSYLIRFGKDKEFGYDLFEKFFKYAPDAKVLFFSPQDEETSNRQQWLRHPLFQSHVRRVINAIDMTISLIDRPKDLEFHIQQLKAYHTIPGIKKVHVEIFMKVLENTLAVNLGKMYTHEYKKAYRKLFTKLYYVISDRVEE